MACIGLYRQLPPHLRPEPHKVICFVLQVRSIVRYLHARTHAYPRACVRAQVRKCGHVYMCACMCACESRVCARASVRVRAHRHCAHAVCRVLNHHTRCDLISRYSKLLLHLRLCVLSRLAIFEVHLYMDSLVVLVVLTIMVLQFYFMVVARTAKLFQQLL